MIGTYARNPVQFVRGAGTRLWDERGDEYLDFLAGISVLNVGHCHPRVVEAVQQQAATLTHASNLYYTAGAIQLSAALARSSLGGKVFLANSGTEANEAAIKLARRARPGGNLIVLEEAFHGRTYGSLSATPQESKQAPFAPLVPGFQTVTKDPAALHDAVDENTAAVLLEPIQGETGIHVLSDELLIAAREACDRTGAALIFDEVQTRDGPHRHRLGLPADAGGARRADQRQGPRRRAADRGAGHRRTARRRAGARRSRLDVRRRAAGLRRGAGGARDLLRTRAAATRSARSASGCGRRLAELPAVASVRGRGLMVGLDLVDGVSAPLLAQRALTEQRLIVNATGPATLRLEPPLIVTESEIDDAISRLARLME